ncbi:MAG: class I SAM-dependent methyltransferase [Methanomassiliicoccales archaeon]|nr:class I SAM-dependent methyltransferase [Methanomassiliicoccales archaeon]
MSEEKDGVDMRTLPEPPVDRFSGRSEEYARARPGYPPGLFDYLFSVRALFPAAKVTDLGSGTGIFSELLLERGLTVYAVEPNREMRSQAEARLGGRPGFVSTAGRAEDTGLADGSMDAATAAQSFHWFGIEETRRELRRVLRPGAEVIMVWNEREKDRDEAQRELSRIMDAHALGKEEINELRDQTQDRFFINGYHEAHFHHAKRYDLESLRCLAVSASYMPRPGCEGYGEMLSDLRAFFDRYSIDGAVDIHYTTNCYHGTLE